MEGAQVVYPPNKPMDRMYWVNTIPSKPGHLNFIDVNEAGQFILGSSDFLSSWWVGSLFFYRNFDDAKDHVSANSYLEETTVSDGKFIDGECAIIASDTGRLTVVKVSAEVGDDLLRAKDSFCNSVRIKQLDVWKSNKKLVTCSENAVTLWNVNGGLAPVHDYRNFHTDIVSSVNCKPAEDIFITGSWDRRLCLWDVRSDMPAMVINDMKMGPITAVSFDQNSDNYVFMGTAGGYVCSIDIRTPIEFLDKNQAYHNKIHQIASHPTSKNVAICADSKDVQTFEVTNGQMRSVYKSSAHRDMARGVVWHKDDLYSCGADSKIHRHFCV